MDMTERMSMVRGRLTRVHQEGIAAPAERVFELLSPVREYEWIQGWSCELVHPASGAMEEGCIFRESRSCPFLLGRRGTTTWVVTRHDPPSLRVEFLLIIGPLAVGNFIVTGERSAADGSAFRFSLTLTPLSEAGSKLTHDHVPRRMEAMIGFLSRAVKQYSETGEMLEAGELMREHGLHHGSRLLGFLHRLAT